jgi:MFS family permease
VPSSLSLWRDANFRLLWLGSTVSTLGSQVTVLAMPLTAVLVFNAGAAETGLLTAAGQAPLLFFNLPVGAWIDRLPRRPVRVIANLASAATTVSVPVAALSGSLRVEHLYVVAFLVGFFSVWSRISMAAIVPGVVGRENLVEANGKMITGFTLSQIGGPALAGVLVQLLTAPVAMLADALSFVFSAVCVWNVRAAEPPRHSLEARSIWHDVFAGLAWLYSEPILFRLTLCIGLANLAWYGVQASIVLFATRDLGISPALLGVSVALLGPAALVGALVAPRVAARFGVGRTLVIALSGELLSRVLLVLAGGPPLVAAAVIGLSYLVFGFIATLWDVNANSLRQSATPEHLLGRAAGASTFVSVGMAPIGALLAGWIGEVASPRAALAETAVVTLIALALLMRSPVPHVHDTLPPRERDGT